MTPTEELTAAADKLDALASNATPALRLDDVDSGLFPEDIGYIEAMSPTVGKSLADLMRIRADQLRQDRRVEGNHPLTSKLLELARLINGGAS